MLVALLISTPVAARAVAATVGRDMSGMRASQAPFVAIPPTVRRDAYDTVPSAAKGMEISWTGSGDHRLVVTDEGKVRRLARLLNALPEEGFGVCSEGFVDVQPSITFRFTGVGGKVLARAIEFSSSPLPVAWCVPTFSRVQAAARCGWRAPASSS